VLPSFVEALRLVIVEVPPIFSVPMLVNVPVPIRAVPTVKTLLLVRVIPVTVTLGIDRSPITS